MVYQNNFQIDPPECVQNAIKAYREENDWLDDFLCECCEIDDSYKEKSGELYSSYRGHCMNTGEYIRGTADFYAAIEHAGFERKRDKSRKVCERTSFKIHFCSITSISYVVSVGDTLIYNFSYKRKIYCI